MSVLPVPRHANDHLPYPGSNRINESQLDFFSLNSSHIFLSPIHFFSPLRSHYSSSEQLDYLGKSILDEDILHEDMAQKVRLSLLCVLQGQPANLLLKASCSRKHRLDHAFKVANFWRGSWTGETRVLCKSISKGHWVLTYYFLVFFNQFQSSDLL